MRANKETAGAELRSRFNRHQKVRVSYLLFLQLQNIRRQCTENRPINQFGVCAQRRKTAIIQTCLFIPSYPPSYRIGSLGGIGLLLIGIVVASVHSPSARPVPFSTASVASGVTDSRPVPRRSFPGNGGGGSNEGDEAYRGFSLSVAKLPVPGYRSFEIVAADEQFDLLALSQNSEVLGTVVPHMIIRSCRVRNVRLRVPTPRAGKMARCNGSRSPTARIRSSRRYERSGRCRRHQHPLSARKPSFNRVILYPGDAAATYRDLGTLDPDYALPDTNDSRRMRGVSANLLCLNNRGTLIALVGNRSWFRRADGTKAPVGNGVAFDLNNNDTAVGFMSAYESGAAMWRNADDPANRPSHPYCPYGRLPGRRGSRTGAVPRSVLTTTETR
jgi:hypothetical protein